MQQINNGPGHFEDQGFNVSFIEVTAVVSDGSDTKLSPQIRTTRAL